MPVNLCAPVNFINKDNSLREIHGYNYIFEYLFKEGFLGLFSLFETYSFFLIVSPLGWNRIDYNKLYVSLHLRVQNAVPAEPCVGKLGIFLVLLNFLDCNFRLWFKTP